ncbi:hypothetical protein ACFZC5_10680 [Nocardia gamkensis]|uniref:hypothetical protein n=1 Tax=Nocardia gamkensis TaxID=352869 RepID=UPI0036F0BA37
MNPLLLIGGAVLAVGLLGLILSVLLRPSGAKAHVTVADLQARLANESATSHEADGPAGEEPRADRPDTERAEQERPRPDDPRNGAADQDEDRPEARADQVLLPHRRRRDG